MNRDRIACDLLSNLYWRFRRLRAYLVHARDTMISGTFEIDEWNYENQREHWSMVYLMNSYRAMSIQNEEIIGHYQAFEWVWLNLMALVERHSPQWRRENVHLIEERLIHAEWIEQMLQQEMRELRLRIVTARDETENN